MLVPPRGGERDTPRVDERQTGRGVLVPPEGHQLSLVGHSRLFVV